MTLRWRPRHGPALRRAPVPFLPLAVSASAHVALIAAMIVGAAAWRAAQPKTYVVNLVPAIATVGAPQGRPTPDLPPRAAELPPAKPAPKELPAPKDLPPPTREAALPERALPSRAPALPRPGDKELPTVASAPTPRVSPTPTAAAPPPPPAPPLGQPSGSPQGAGTVTLNVSDFPFAYYIQIIGRKIQEQWEGRALPGRQPEVIFEIARNGQIRRLAVGRSSGNPAYDQIALRAIADANPFPELPKEFTKPTLTVGLQFVYDPRTR